LLLVVEIAHILVPLCLYFFSRLGPWFSLRYDLHTMCFLLSKFLDRNQATPIVVSLKVIDLAIGILAM